MSTRYPSESVNNSASLRQNVAKSTNHRSSIQIDFSDHCNKCRNCFQSLTGNNSYSKVQILKDELEKFKSITGIQLKIAFNLGMFFCLRCHSAMRRVSKFQRRVSAQSSPEATEGCCRLCMKNFPVNGLKVEIMVLDRKTLSRINLKLSTITGLMCQKCDEELQNFAKFRKQSIYVQRKFEDFLETLCGNSFNSTGRGSNQSKASAKSRPWNSIRTSSPIRKSHQSSQRSSTFDTPTIVSSIDLTNDDEGSSISIPSDLSSLLPQGSSTLADIFKAPQSVNPSSPARQSNPPNSPPTKVLNQKIIHEPTTKVSNISQSSDADSPKNRTYTIELPLKEGSSTFKNSSSSPQRLSRKIVQYPTPPSSFSSSASEVSLQSIIEEPSMHISDTSLLSEVEPIPNDGTRINPMPDLDVFDHSDASADDTWTTIDGIKVKKSHQLMLKELRVGLVRVSEASGHQKDLNNHTVAIQSPSVVPSIEIIPEEISNLPGISYKVPKIQSPSVVQNIEIIPEEISNLPEISYKVPKIPKRTKTVAKKKSPANRRPLNTSDLSFFSNISLDVSRLNCEYCDGRLKRHRRSCNKSCGCQRPTVCPICHEIIGNNYSLIRHLTLDHDQTFACLHCSESFDTKLKLDQHTRKSHDVRYQCPICPRTFTTPANCERHKLETHKNVNRRAKCPYPACNRTQPL